MTAGLVSAAAQGGFAAAHPFEARAVPAVKAVVNVSDGTGKGVKFGVEIKVDGKRVWGSPTEDKFVKAGDSNPYDWTSQGKMTFTFYWVKSKTGASERRDNYTVTEPGSITNLRFTSSGSGVNYQVFLN